MIIKKHIELIKTIGNELRGVRESKQLQVKDIAKDVGVTSTYISDIERNNKVPSVELIERLSEAYEVPRNQLYKGFQVVTQPMIVELCRSNGIYDLLFELAEDPSISTEEKDAFYTEIRELFRKKFENKA